jgi:GAF domain-containing protein
MQKSLVLENGSRQTVLALPIKLRNQVIGALDIHFNGTSIPQDLAQLLEATATRLALALENARLLEELKMRAERERLVGDITTRVRSSTAVQDILSSAAEELGRNLGVSEVVVQLRSTEE